MKNFISKLPDWLFIIVTAIAVVLLFLFYTPTTRAQNVTRKGNVFVQDTSSRKTIKKAPFTLTKFYYQASDGTKYPIYMSSNGKCFIIRTSKNGKQYRQYLPEVTKELSK